MIRKKKQSISRIDLFSRLEKNDKTFLRHTGMTYQMFQRVLSLTKNNIEKKAIQSSSWTFTTPNRLLMTLMMLKHSLKNSIIKTMFGVTDNFICRNFRHIVFCVTVVGVLFHGLDRGDHDIPFWGHKDHWTTPTFVLVAQGTINAGITEKIRAMP